MKDWALLSGEAAVQNAVDSLKKQNFEVFVVENKDLAREKVLEIIPKGAEVMTMRSETLEQSGLNKEINESGNYDSLRTKLSKMDRTTQGREMQKLGSSPEWTIGSVHAVTEGGRIYIASATGSQLGPYVFTSPHVIWLVGTQKIVKDDNEAIKRVYEYCLPKESERQIAMGSPVGSNVGKLLIVNKEFRPGRVTIIFVKENLGF